MLAGLEAFYGRQFRRYLKLTAKVQNFRGYFFHCSNCFTVFMVIPLAVLRIQSFKDTDLCRG